MSPKTIDEELAMASEVEVLGRTERVGVWVVEDDRSFRNSLVASLSADARIYCEADFSACEDALKYLESESPPDVVLLDVIFDPGMTGIEGAKRIREIAPSTLILMLTNYADDDKIFRAICAGASGYLLKTSTEEQITRSILDAVNGGAPMTAQIARRVLDMFSRSAGVQGSYGITKREAQILQLMVEGLTKRQSADKLFLSLYTVETHLKNIYAKLHVHNRSGAVSKAIKERLV